VVGEWGVSHIFACPGSTEAAFLYAAARQSEIDVLLTTHEAIAVSMADGFARATGRAAVAYLHANVGLTNGLSHLFAAQLAHSPVVILNGVKPTSIQNRGGFTTAPYMRDFVRQYVKSAWQTLSAEAIAEDVNRALKMALSAPAGPTWVGIAQDLLEARVELPTLDTRRFDVASRVRPSVQDVRRAADLLVSADKIVVVAGAQVPLSGGEAALVALAERLNVPVLHEDRRAMERTAFPTDHPNFAGMYSPSRDCVKQADVIFFAGARGVVEFEPPVVPAIPSGAKVIHLYDDANEIAKIYGVDVALVGDAAETLREVNGVVAAAASDRPDKRQGFLEAARAEYRQVLRVALDSLPAGGEVISVPELMKELARHVDGNTTVVSDCTTSGEALLHAFQASRAIVHATPSGSLGWGVGAALGIQLAEPNRRVVAVLGDGAFQFGVPGLWTAVKYGIPVTFVVVNNQAYAAIGAAIRRYSGQLTDAERALAVDLTGPGIADIARGFGVTSSRATTLAEVSSLMEAALASSAPTLIEVMTDPEYLGP
jgi:thiamine pyrophosphate-dependent acetolactate synthase large subunit-like protein